METTYQLSGHPLFFARNRVFRVYQGGKLFHGFFGDPPEDGCYPEEWIASAVEAGLLGMQMQRNGPSAARGGIPDRGYRHLPG